MSWMIGASKSNGHGETMRVHPASSFRQRDRIRLLIAAGLPFRWDAEGAFSRMRPGTFPIEKGVFTITPNPRGWRARRRNFTPVSSFPLCSRDKVALKSRLAQAARSEIVHFLMEPSVRILILEDDPFIALDLQSLLEDRGHEVVGVFSSLAEARDHLDDGFDYALLDIDVVDGKSFGIAAELQEKRIPFAFVSASRPMDIPAPLGEASFIPKPYEEKAILRSVEQGGSSVRDGSRIEDLAQSWFRPSPSWSRA